MDQFIAEIRVVPFNFAPAGWAHCNGQLLPVSQNTALFSILGTTYGGNGTSTFALPDIQSRVVHGPDQGPGLSDYDLGEVGGAEIHTLLQSEIPAHSHTPRAVPDPAEVQAPAADRALARSSGGFAYQSNTSNNLVAMAPETLSRTGGDQPHQNTTPVLVLKFIIALQGIFPSRWPP